MYGKLQKSITRFNEHSLTCTSFLNTTNLQQVVEKISVENKRVISANSDSDSNTLLDVPASKIGTRKQL